MRIVFDMDNTLTDELGSSLRPGMVDLLQRLKQANHTLILWTSSKRERAEIILADFGLQRYFSLFLYREDYDPGNAGIPKDIRKVDGDMLIDDDPRQIEYVRSIGKRGFVIQAYRGGSDPDEGEIERLEKAIGESTGWFRRWLR